MATSIMFARTSRATRHSNEPVEWSTGEINGSIDVVGISPGATAINRSFGAILPQRSDA